MSVATDLPGARPAESYTGIHEDDRLPGAQPSEQAGATAKPVKKAPKAKPAKPAETIAGAIIGLPVQFCQNEGEVLPALLQRPTRTDPALWDLVVFITGGVSIRHRFAVRHSTESPKPGHWNFLPKD